MVSLVVLVATGCKDSKQSDSQEQPTNKAAQKESAPSPKAEPGPKEPPAEPPAHPVVQPKPAPTVAPAPKVKLPRYSVVSVDPLRPKKGSRVIIHASADITDAQCAAIINAERSKGAPDGQVAVQVPMPNEPNEYLPLCVDNFEGKGVEKGMAREIIKAFAE